MADNRLFQSILRWGPAVILMVVIFIASSTPSTSMPNFGIVDLIVKKGGHMLGYGLLCLSNLRGVQDSGKKGIMLALALTVLYAASDELHQSFVLGRGSTWVDVIIDSAGAGLALLAWSKWAILQRYTGMKLDKKRGDLREKIRVQQ